MRTILFFLSIYCFAVGSPINSKAYSTDDYRYDYKMAAWYKYHNIPATWHDADMRCRLEGGLLASPVDQVQKQAMLDILEQNPEKLSFGSTDRAVFTGIHGIYSKVYNATVQGTPLTEIEHLWAPNEPDNEKIKESCLALFQKNTFGYVNCEQTLPYICFKQNHEPNMFLTKCGTVDTEYHFKSETGHCYKIHKTPASWPQAYLTCQAEQASLSFINSETESELLSQIFKTANIINFIQIDVDGKLSVTPYYAHIGFRVFDDTLLWKTIEGQTLESAGFATFGNGEPNNPGKENCGSINEYGRLNDIFCDALAPFICEIIPPSDEVWAVE